MTAEAIRHLRGSSNPTTAAVVEGVENYVKNGKQVSLPYMSTFLFRGPLICEWRDYFDLQTVLKQLDLPLDGSRPLKAAASA